LDTTLDEIAPGIFRISTYVPQIAAPAGFTFNQFLVVADQPLLFHCGPRQLFEAVSATVRRVLPPERLRWITFGHLESDECGAMNHWLALAPRAEVAHGQVGCMISLQDMADRAPRALADQEVLDLGGKRVRHLDTPHVPHGWDARVLYEETTGTLFCGDLFTHLGRPKALGTNDLVEPALEAERLFQASCLTPKTAPTLRKLAQLAPTTLALMHGGSFQGDGAAQLEGLARGYEALLVESAREPVLQR
jgi:flavorubredoxin